MNIKVWYTTCISYYNDLWCISNTIQSDRKYTGLTLRHYVRHWMLSVYSSTWWSFMMTSSNGNIFRVTGPLCGEFTGPGEFPTQRPVTQSFDIFFDLRLNKRLNKQSWGWWFETLSRPFWRHRNARKLPRLPYRLSDYKTRQFATNVIYVACEGTCTLHTRNM